MQIYMMDDLSGGIEQDTKVNVINKYNFDTIRPFDYITKLKIANEIQDSFTPIQGCLCLDSCKDNSGCNCDGKERFCNAACSCVSRDCPKRYKPAKHKYQVFYVNPKKGWGLRTLQSIKKGAILFEYTGVLTEDQENIEEDDYIYAYEYRGKKYMINANSAGNLARFINHSCASNCNTQLSVTESNGIPHLFIISRKNIGELEELTLDYGEKWWKVKMQNGKVCLCESIHCKYQKEELNDNVESIEPINGQIESSSNNNEPIILTPIRPQISTAKKSYQRTIPEYVINRQPDLIEIDEICIEDDDIQIIEDDKEEHLDVQDREVP